MSELPRNFAPAVCVLFVAGCATVTLWSALLFPLAEGRSIAVAVAWLGVAFMAIPAAAILVALSRAFWRRIHR